MAQEPELTDLSVFEKKISDVDNATCKTGHYQTCLAINRLAYGLRYYSVLNLLYNTRHLAIFNNFVGELYPSHHFLNDYIHLMDEHEKELKQIKTYLIEKLNLFKTCNLKDCQFTARHQSGEQGQDDDDYIDKDEQDEQEHQKHKTRKRNRLDPQTALYQQTFDALHFYLFHLFDAGLRFDAEEEEDEAKQDTEDEKEDEKKTDDKYFDAAFARINRTILQRSKITSSFGRFNANHEQNKFDLHGMDATKKKYDQTYLDSIYKRLSALKFSTELIGKLRAFIEAERYDSESVTNDMSDSRDEVGNILQALSKTNAAFVNYLESMIRAETTKSFSVGYRFYYWQWFKHQEELQGENWANNIDHAGHAVRDMYVQQKYSSFKQELLEYDNEFNVHIYNKRVLPKAKRLMLSKKVKTMKAEWWSWMEPSLDHYGVRQAEALRFSNLVAVILYTDYSALSAAFSSSFRKKTVFETLSETKKRNSRFWWWAKTLRETVELYGQKYDEEDFHGPFYCGVSVRLNMPSFLIRLHAPTSTSIYQEVARNFCGTKGIIIQLNNTSGDPVENLSGFNVSWISRYPSESERLFFGGYFPIQIESIFVMQTNRNFRTVMGTLYILDRMISGQYDREELHDTVDVSLLPSLFAMHLGGDTKVRFDEYVVDTFAHYVDSKTEIYLELDTIVGASSYVGIKELLMSKNKKKWDMNKEANSDLRAYALKEDEDSNLFNDSLLRIFTNVAFLRLYTATRFPISFMSLLKLIGSTLLTKIVIEAHVVKAHPTWLDVVFDEEHECSSKIKTAYNDAGFDICIEDAQKKEYRHCVITKR